MISFIFTGHGSTFKTRPNPSQKLRTAFHCRRRGIFTGNSRLNIVSGEGVVVSREQLFLNQNPLGSALRQSAEDGTHSARILVRWLLISMEGLGWWIGRMRCDIEMFDPRFGGSNSGNARLTVSHHTLRDLLALPTRTNLDLRRDALKITTRTRERDIGQRTMSMSSTLDQKRENKDRINATICTHALGHASRHECTHRGSTNRVDISENILVHSLRSMDKPPPHARYTQTH